MLRRFLIALCFLPFFAGAVPINRDRPTVHERPAVFSHMKRVTLNSAAWAQIDLRLAAWLPASPQLTVAQSATAQTRAVLKRVTMRLVSGTSLDYGEEADPSDRYNSVDAAAPVMQKDYSLQNRISSFYYRTDGAVVIEFEFWFDILD